MGAATAEMLTKLGHRVIGVDLRGVQVGADLSDAAGRTQAIRAILDLAGGVVDSVIACAGLRHAVPDTVSVNFFGSVELVEGLHDALGLSAAPRVVLTSSLASVLPHDPLIVEACLSRDETAARAAAASSTPDENGRARVYSSSKTAVSRWVRRIAATPGWGGSGILVNAIAPGTVATAMMADVMETAEGRAKWLAFLPNAQNRFPVADEAAELFCWLASPANSLLLGQTLFADLGSELYLRGDEYW
jgi:NAD(P)-dependent dehydrogenase (short-subunit alcohol dehydrogenase family)